MTEAGPLQDKLRSRIAVVRELIDLHAPDPERVTLVAVTKTWGNDVVEAALAAGLRDLGENYAQELQGKAEEVANRDAGDRGGNGLNGDVRWHMIGPVQRNKVKRIAPHVHLWHTVDRIELATEIAKRAPGSRVLVQVNATNEESKSGASSHEVPQLVEECLIAGLDVIGLMTMGPTDATVNPRPAFALTRQIADDLGLPECSMGMTRDVSVALEEGATLIRVGSALFGART